MINEFFNVTSALVFITLFVGFVSIINRINFGSGIWRFGNY